MTSPEIDVENEGAGEDHPEDGDSDGEPDGQCIGVLRRWRRFGDPVGGRVDVFCATNGRVVVAMIVIIVVVWKVFTIFKMVSSVPLFPASEII